MDAEQTGLRGAIVASRQRDENRALEVGGKRARVLRRSETRQAYEGPGQAIGGFNCGDGYEAP